MSDKKMCRDCVYYEEHLASPDWSVRGPDDEADGCDKYEVESTPDPLVTKLRDTMAFHLGRTTLDDKLWVMDSDDALVIERLANAIRALSG
jgi:hypothetical protein